MEILIDDVFELKKIWKSYPDGATFQVESIDNKTLTIRDCCGGNIEKMMIVIDQYNQKKTVLFRKMPKPEQVKISQKPFEPC